MDTIDRGQILDVSWGTILKVAVALLCFYVLYLIKDVLVWIVFAMIISILFNPAIDFLQKMRFPRVISTILVYVALFGIIGFIVYWTAPFFVSEIQQFSQAFPQYFEKISPPLRGLGIEAFESFGTFTQVLENGLQKASANIFSAIGAIFGGIFSAVSIFSLAIFLSIEERGIDKTVALLSPQKYESYFLSLWERSQKKVAGWFGVRILSCVFVGILTSIACYILSIKYAITFGLMAGALDIIPVIGPIIAGVVIVLFTALSSFVYFPSWLVALLILVIFILIQLVEGNILMPILTRKFIGLPPVIVLIALLIGGRLWGILGAILAIPLAGMFFEFLKDFLEKRKEAGSKNGFSVNGQPFGPADSSSKKVVVL